MVFSMFNCNSLVQEYDLWFAINSMTMINYNSLVQQHMVCFKCIPSLAWMSTPWPVCDICARISSVVLRFAFVFDAVLDLFDDWYVVVQFPGSAVGVIVLAEFVFAQHIFVVVLHAGPTDVSLSLLHYDGFLASDFLGDFPWWVGTAIHCKENHICSG